MYALPVFFVSIIHWCISFFISTFSFILKTIVQSKCPNSSETSVVVADPQVRYLNYQITSKSARLKISTDKIQEIKKTISNLEIKSGQVQLKYDTLLKQLKYDLYKTSSEFQSLQSQITRMMEKRRRVDQNFW